MATNTPAVLYRGNAVYGATNVQRTITTAALTSNVVTITTGTAHGITQVGTPVVVSGVSSVYDGVYPVNSVPTGTTFTYTKTNANITSGAVTPNASAVFNSGTTAGGSVSNVAIVNYTGIITTGSSHGLAIGDLVAIGTGTGVDTGCAVVLSVPSTTIFTIAVSTQTLASTGISAGSFGKYPPAYTVPALTSAVLSNAVFTNTSPQNTANIFLAIDNVPVTTGLLVNTNGVQAIDLKQYAATAKNIVIGSTTGAVFANLSGMTIA
jgi:hypothetical protein